MARRRTTRAGDRWQPVSVARPGKRVAGRRQRRWPRPRFGAYWRRAFLLALVLASVTAAGVGVYRSPVLSVQGVRVEGTNVLSVEEVRLVADLEGRSLLRPDFAGARQRLLALPMVKDVRISRDLPRDAHVRIVERTPMAVWQIGEERYVIDAEGVVLDMLAPTGIPVIVQTDAAWALAPGDRVDRGAVDVVAQLVPTAKQTLDRTVIALEFSQARGLTVVLAGSADERDGLWVTFGDAQGYDFKVAALYAVLQQAEEEGRTLRRVDLRFGDRVAVQ